MNQQMRFANAVLACASDIADELTILMNSEPDDEIMASIRRIKRLNSTLTNMAGLNGGKPTAASGLRMADLVVT